MRKFLQMSLLHYQQLNNESLDSVEFERLALKLKEEMIGSFPPSTVPWNAEGVLQGLSNTVSSIRTQRSSGWINALEESLAGLERMDVSDANRLHGQGHHAAKLSNRKGRCPPFNLRTKY
jgi:hypothetical protein